MSFPKCCPSCGTSLVGSPIISQGETTWRQIAKKMIASGIVRMLAGMMPPPPGVDTFYSVIITCIGCNKRHADFLLCNSRDSANLSQFTMKRDRYKKANTITPEILRPEIGCVVQMRNPGALVNN
jgi:hypothetical protein